MLNIAQGKPYVGGKIFKLHLFHWEVCFFPTCSSTRLTHFHDFQGPSSHNDPIITYLLVGLISWDTLIDPSHICFFGNIGHLPKQSVRRFPLAHLNSLCKVWDKSVLQLGTSWGTHWELWENLFGNTIRTIRNLWEHTGNIVKHQNPTSPCSS
jgi:hypothetical protein